MYKIGLVRVLTTADPAVLLSHGKLLEQYFPNFQVESRCIPDQPKGIYSDETKAIAVPKIIKLVQECFREKDAIIISCADDPAVPELTQLLDIPVVGAGTAVSRMANCAFKVGVLGITEVVPAPYVQGLGDALLYLGVPNGVSSTLDLMTTTGRADCLQKAMDLKAAGAQSIALACTGFSTVSMARELESQLGIPVLDPVLCEGLITYFELLRR